MSVPFTASSTKPSDGASSACQAAVASPRSGFPGAGQNRGDLLGGADDASGSGRRGHEVRDRLDFGLHQALAGSAGGDVVTRLADGDGVQPLLVGSARNRRRRGAPRWGSSASRRRGRGRASPRRCPCRPASHPGDGPSGPMLTGIPPPPTATTIAPSSRPRIAPVSRSPSAGARRRCRPPATGILGMVQPSSPPSGLGLFRKSRPAWSDCQKAGSSRLTTGVGDDGHHRSGQPAALSSL